MSKNRPLLRAIAAAIAPRTVKQLPAPAMNGVVGSGGWYSIVREPFAGGWQRNLEVSSARAMTFYADFSCRTLIAQDIAKLPIRLMQRDKDGVWTETTNPAFSPVLRKPNSYQTRNQFWESWILSKLGRGNTYILKVRDARRIVVELHVLNPDRVRPLVADDGSVFYQLFTDDMRQYEGQPIVPATEIIHDRMNTIFCHPLVGVPPIWASALAATQGLNIQTQSARLFQNSATPGGILTAPGHIPPETADRIKTQWESKFSGDNAGRVAVLGDDLKFSKLSMTADESQLIEQLGWTGEVICSTYHVPPFKIGIGQLPSYNNGVVLEDIYFKSCLQSLLESAESCLDDGLGLGEQYDLGVEFDVDNLLRMDASAQLDALEKGKNYLTPNEGRKRLNLPKVAGGDSVYRQQQDFSLEALAKRDASADPFKTAPAATAPDSKAAP